MFWATVLLLAAGGLVMAVSPLARAAVINGWDASTRPLIQLFEAHCPVSLKPLVSKGASVILTPWLYLLMMVVFIAEKYVPADRRQRVWSVGMVQDFIGWFIFGGVFRVVLIGVLVSGLYFFCQRYLAGARLSAVDRWPMAVRVVLAVLAGDLTNWLHHFIRHKVQMLWLFHTVHHSQRQMNMFTDLRVHLVEYVVAKPLTLFPLFVLGLDVELAFWLTLVLESYTRVYHGNLRTNYGLLRYVLVTPQSHRIHHSIEPRHQDKNFAVLFSFWDRLFGTQWTGYDEYPPTGVVDECFPHERSLKGMSIFTTYLHQLAYPFVGLWLMTRGRGRRRDPAPIEDSFFGESLDVEDRGS